MFAGTVRRTEAKKKEMEFHEEVLRREGKKRKVEPEERWLKKRKPEKRKTAVERDSHEGQR